MNIHARYGFPRIRWPLAALALLLAGCSSGPKRLDELAISSFRPGQTRYEDVLRELDVDPKRDAAAWSREHGAEEEYIFGPRWHEWSFSFDSGGRMRACSRVAQLCSMFFSSARAADVWESWFDKAVATHAVDPSRAAEFVPGKTNQAEVVAIWGACTGAQALDSRGFVMRWGALNDAWSLEFDAGGVLSRTPQH